MKLIEITQSHPALIFLGFTFGLSILGFLCIANIAGAESPDNLKGMPFWVFTVWSPTIATLLTWQLQGKLTGQLLRAIQFPPLWTIIVAVLPLGILAIVLWSHQRSGAIHWDNFRVGYLAPLIIINLLLGPLGEELGWRGFLYPIWRSQLGWMGAALSIGVIWGIWHLPLWSIDSPQAEIPFLVFLGHTIFFSVFMGAVTNFSEGSIWPAILIHLWVNVAVAIPAILESHSTSQFFQDTLWYYGILAAVATACHELFTPKFCAATA